MSEKNLSWEITVACIRRMRFVVLGVFYQSVWTFVIIICIACPLFALSVLVEARLSLAWRVYLVEKLLNTYFENRCSDQ